MKILSVNAGSSSLKFQVYEMPNADVLMSGSFERIGIDGSFYTININGKKIEKKVELKKHKEAVIILTEELLNYNVISDLKEIKGIGHRVVHGGDIYSTSVIIDDDTIKNLNDLIPLAPLHNPANIVGIEAFKSIIPTAVQVAVFDTAFHQTLSEQKFLYPVPYDWYKKYGIRKYGFHGTSHKYLTNRISEILKTKNLKVINCHIGNGGSISAVLNGKCIDTTMGFTPNSGIMMGTRCGDIDATIIPYVMKKTGKEIDEVFDDLNKKSGLLGISESSSDYRDIEAGRRNGDAKSILAREMYVDRIVNYISQYYVELGGCDVIVFSAGVGENDINIRKDILNKIKIFGVIVDEEKNSNVKGETLISSNSSTIKVYVIPTDEEKMIAKETYNLIVK